MATPFSNPNLYFQLKPVDPSNWDLAFKALQMKQSAYDANDLKIQQTVQQYVNIDILQPAVREKLYNNLKNLTSEINALGGVELTNATTSNILSHISQALDPSVVNAIGVTKQFRDYNNLAHELQTKKPDLYSDINYQDGLRRKDQDGKSLMDYMQSTDPNATWNGNLTYTPFVDVDANQDKRLMEFIKLNGDQEVTYQDPNDPTGLTMVKKKISGLNDTELTVFFQNSLSRDEINQLEINARERYGWFESGEAISALETDFVAFKEKGTKITRGNIATIKANMEKEEEGTEAYNILTQKLGLEENKLNRIVGMNIDFNTTNSPTVLSNIASQMYIEDWTTGKVAQFSNLYKESIVGYEINDIQKFKIEYDRGIQEHEETMQLKRAELAIKQQKADADAQKEAKNQGSFTVIDDITVTPDGYDPATEVFEEQEILKVQTIGAGLTYLERINNVISSPSDFEESQVKEAKNIKTAYLGQIILNGVEASDLTKTVEELQEKYDPNMTVFNTVLRSQGGASISIGVVDGVNLYSELNNGLETFGLRQTQIKEIEDRAKKSLEDQDIESLDIISNNEYDVFVEKKDGSFGRLKAKNLLSNNDVLDSEGKPIKGKKLSDSKYKKHIERTFFAGKFLDSDSNPSEALDAITKLARSFGENFTSINKPTNQGGARLEGSQMAQPSLDVNSKTYKYLSAVIPQYKNKWIGSNISLWDDGGFRNSYYLNKDYTKTQTYIDGINSLKGNIGTNVRVGVDPNTTLGDDIRNIVSTKGLGNLDVGESAGQIIIKQTPDGYAIEQTRRIKNEDIPISFGILTQNDIDRNSLLGQHLNLNKTKGKYTYSTVGSKPFYSQPISFLPSSVSREVKNSITVDPIIQNYLTKDSAIQHILQSRSQENQVLANIKQANIDPLIFNKFENAINNAGQYKVQVKLGKDRLGEYAEMTLVDKNSGKVVYTPTQPEYGVTELDEIIKLSNDAPQVLYINMLMEIANRNYISNSTNLNFDPVTQTGAYFDSAYKTIFK